MDRVDWKVIEGSLERFLFNDYNHIPIFNISLVLWAGINLPYLGILDKKDFLNIWSLEKVWMVAGKAI